MENQVILITGGTGGLGDAMSKMFLEKKATVVVIDRNEERIQPWVEEKKSSGFEKVSGFSCDITDYEACQKTIAAIKENQGRIDVLVNNAGITQDAMFKKMSKEQWESVIDVNLKSLYNVTRPVLEIMLDNQYGRIINISSVNGHKGQFGQANYSATKSGMYGFTKALALETAKKNITVNSVSPGYMETAMITAMPKDIQEQVRKTIPMERFGQPNEIARVILFLADKDAGYITGSDLSVNGGLYMY